MLEDPNHNYKFQPVTRSTDRLAEAQKFSLTHKTLVFLELNS